MKKRIILFVLVCFLAGGFSAFASPPHPSNKNPTGRERQDPTIGSREPFYKSLTRKGPSDGRARAPFSGTITMYVLVLLVNFSDMSMDPGSTPAFYENMLETGPGLTMRKYYQDMSQNHLNLEFTVVGPYTVSENLAYYGANGASGASGDDHSWELVQDTLAEFFADSTYTGGYNQFDNNGDGFADGIFVIHAGRGEETGAAADTIWSYQYSLTASGFGPIPAPDETKFDIYTIEPEYNYVPGDSSVGVFCHEFGHVLGLPDLYDVKYETDGIGLWSLMAGGQWGSLDIGTDPAPLLAWERYFLGGDDWITLEVLGSSAHVIIDDIETAPGKAFKINLNSPGQYLILEGKKRVTDNINPFVPADGILITQIHEGIISKYGNTSSVPAYFNTVATGFNRVHGINILEAATFHDEAGRGHLWLDSYPNVAKYANIPFSSETRNYLRGSYNVGARGPFFPTGFPASAWPVCAAAVFFFFFGKARRKRVFSAFAVTLALSAFLLTCSMDGSDDDNGAGGGYKLVSHPNSNYYLSEDIYSKTGISGVTLKNISSRASFPMTFDLELE